MTIPTGQPTRFDRALTGPDITVGGHTLRPVARMTGQYTSGGNGSSVRGYGSVRAVPAEVIVRRGDGAEQRLRVTDPTGTAFSAWRLPRAPSPRSAWRSCSSCGSYTGAAEDQTGIEETFP